MHIKAIRFKSPVSCRIFAKTKAPKIMNTVELVKPENAVFQSAIPIKAQQVGIRIAGTILSKNSKAITNKKNIVITQNCFIGNVYTSLHGITAKIIEIPIVASHFIISTLLILFLASDMFIISRTKTFLSGYIKDKQTSHRLLTIIAKKCLFYAVRRQLNSAQRFYPYSYNYGMHTSDQ